MPGLKHSLVREDRLPQSRLLAGLILCALVLCPASIGWTQSDGNGIGDQELFDELKSRVEQLEHDNHDLRLALCKDSNDPLVPLVSGSLITDLPPAPEVDEESANASADGAKMESLVEGFIRRIDEQSKEKLEERNQRLESLDSRIAEFSKKPPRRGGGMFGSNNLTYTSADGNFKAHAGGTIQLDLVSPGSLASGIVIPAGAYGDQVGTNFRRLRSRLDGTMYRTIDYVLELEYSSNIQDYNSPNTQVAASGLRSVGPTSTAGAPSTNQQGGNTFNALQAANVWINVKDVPIFGNIRIGNQQDWFSLDHVQGARFADFMERAPMIDIFTGPRNNGFAPGIAMNNSTSNKMAGIQLGIFKNNVYDGQNTFSIDNAFMYDARGYWLPYYDEASDGRYMVHTALGAEYRTFDNDPAPGQQGENIRIRSRGDMRIVSSQLTPNFLDTGNFFVSEQAIVDPEFAMVWGPLTLQAEYCTGWFFGARTTNLPGGQALNNVVFNSGYAEAMYFLTGEHKPYDHVRGSFGHVLPKKNWAPAKGQYGAWQLGARYDWSNLNSGLITGGRNENVTLGVNWFLNPTVRFQFNLVFSYIDNNSTTSVASTAANNPGDSPTKILSNGLSAASNNAGALNGSKFSGEGLITTLGTRMDINF